MAVAAPAAAFAVGVPGGTFAGAGPGAAAGAVAVAAGSGSGSGRSMISWLPSVAAPRSLLVKVSRSLARLSYCRGSSGEGMLGAAAEPGAGAAAALPVVAAVAPAGVPAAPGSTAAAPGSAAVAAPVAVALAPALPASGAVAPAALALPGFFSAVALAAALSGGGGWRNASS